jgi:hypothetical protein
MSVIFCSHAHKDSNEPLHVPIRQDWSPPHFAEDGLFANFGWAQLRRPLSVCVEPWPKMTGLAVCLAKGMAFYCPVELDFRAFGALLALQPCSGMLPGRFLLKMPLNTPDFKHSQQRIYYLDSIKLGGIREHFDLALHSRAHVDRVHPDEQPTLGARNGSKNMGIILLHAVERPFLAVSWAPRSVIRLESPRQPLIWRQLAWSGKVILSRMAICVLQPLAVCHAPA